MAKNRSPVKALKTEKGREELRRLAKVITDLADSDSKIVMISSCNRGEGASSVVVNLAQLIAQESTDNVLLIDANLRHPVLHEAFDMPQTPGLTDFISGESEFAQIVLDTGMTNLRITPSGSAVPDPVPVLRSPRLSDFFAEVRDGFRLALLDSSPIIPFSDPMHIAPRADLTFLVIEAERTRWEVTQEAIRKLEQVGRRVPGMILNKKRFHIPAFVYRRI